MLGISSPVQAALSLGIEREPDPAPGVASFLLTSQYDGAGLGFSAVEYDIYNSNQVFAVGGIIDTEWVMTLGWNALTPQEQAIDSTVVFVGPLGGLLPTETIDGYMRGNIHWFGPNEDSRLELIRVVVPAGEVSTYDISLYDGSGIEYRSQGSLVAPEPGSLAMVLLGATGLMARRRRSQ